MKTTAALRALISRLAHDLDIDALPDSSVALEVVLSDGCALNPLMS